MIELDKLRNNFGFTNIVEFFVQLGKVHRKQFISSKLLNLQ